jgi:hypothetical protein
LRSVNDLSAPDDEESAVADVGRVDLAVVVRQHHQAGGRRTDNGLLAFLKKIRVKLKLGFEKDNWKHLLRQQPKTYILKIIKSQNKAMQLFVRKN